MRDVYQSSYKSGRGFTAQDWWGAVSRAANGKSFADFNARYIDGREAFPWKSILPLAGLRLKVDSIKEPRLGVFTAMDSNGTSVKVTELEAGGAAEEAGVKIGDELISVGDVAVDEGFGPRFRGRYGRSEGQIIPIKVTRGRIPMVLQLKVRMTVSTRQSMTFDATASPKAMRVRRGLLTGVTGR